MSSEPTARAADSPMDVSSEKKSMFPGKVPPRLRPVVTKAEAMDTSEGPGVLEEKVRALRNAVADVKITSRSLSVEASDSGVDDNSAGVNSGEGDAEATLSEDQVARIGEERAKKQMPQQQLAAYNAWCTGSFQPPTVSEWDVFKTSEQSLIKNAKDFRAGPLDLNTLYKTSNLTLQHLAGWLADPSLSTDEAREALKGIGRVRRVRGKVSNVQSRAGGTRGVIAQVEGSKGKLQRKDVRVLKGVIKSVRTVRKELQRRVRKVMVALKDAEGEAKTTLRAVDLAGRRAERGRRRGNESGRRDRKGAGNPGGGLAPPTNAVGQDATVAPGASAVGHAENADAGTGKDMQT